MRSLCLLSLLAACTVLSVASVKKPSDAKSSAKVSVISLTIRNSPMRYGIPPNGTTLELIVSLPDQFIVGLDTEATKLESFTDDKKNDLSKKNRDIYGSQWNWISELPNQSGKDGDCCLRITAAGTPGEGTSKVLAKGSLALKCGKGEKTLKQKTISRKVNEEVQIGDFKVRILGVAESFSTVMVASAEPRVKCIEFVDESGKVIDTPAPSRAINPLGAGGKPEAAVAYAVRGKMEKISFKLTYFSKIETVSVPFDVRVGLDLK